MVQAVWSSWGQKKLKKVKKTVDKLSFVLYTNNIIKREREKTMFDKDGNYYPNDDELNEFEESEETE